MNYCTGLFRHLLLLPMIEQQSDSSGFGSMVNGNKEEEGDQDRIGTYSSATCSAATARSGAWLHV